MVCVWKRWRSAGRLLAIAGTLGVVACSPESALPDAQAIARAQQMVPTDTTIAALYERSCRTCHSQVEAKAPLTGFAPQWRARLAQGMPVLLAHVRDGYLGMPARGYCNDCSDKDYEALIGFMSTHQSGGAL